MTTPQDRRATAFEQQVSAAGKILESELAAGGGKPGEPWDAPTRAAWDKYFAAQDAAGDAFRAAQAAEHEVSEHDRAAICAAARGGAVTGQVLRITFPSVMTFILACSGGVYRCYVPEDSTEGHR